MQFQKMYFLVPRPLNFPDANIFLARIAPLLKVIIRGLFRDFRDFRGF